MAWLQVNYEDAILSIVAIEEKHGDRIPIRFFDANRREVTICPPGGAFAGEGAFSCPSTFFPARKLYAKVASKMPMQYRLQVVLSRPGLYCSIPKFPIDINKWSESHKPKPWEPITRVNPADLVTDVKQWMKKTNIERVLPASEVSQFKVELERFDASINASEAASKPMRESAKGRKRPAKVTHKQ